MFSRRMNRSLQEYLRCVIYGNDTKYKEWSRDVKLFPLANNSEITTTLRISPYEMVLNRKPRKTIMFTANSQKNTRLLPTYKRINLLLSIITYSRWRSFSSPTNLKASLRHTYWMHFKQRFEKMKFSKQKPKNYYKDRMFNPKYNHDSHQLQT